MVSSVVVGVVVVSLVLVVSVLLSPPGPLLSSYSGLLE